MKKTLKQFSVFVAVAALVVTAGLGIVAPKITHAAAINSSVCQGVSLADGSSSTDCSEDSTNSFGALAKRVVNIFSLVVGAVSVIMIIIGGFRYIVSNGDSNAVTGAKNSILYAVVGLVIVLFAQVIVRFVLTNAAKDAA